MHFGFCRERPLIGRKPPEHARRLNRFYSFAIDPMEFCRAFGPGKIHPRAVAGDGMPGIRDSIRQPTRHVEPDGASWFLDMGEYRLSR